MSIVQAIYVLTKEWLSIFWDWFWYFRRGKIRYRVFDYGYTYNAMASDGTTAVFNCYGSTPEAAKELALFRLQQAGEEI